MSAFVHPGTGELLETEEDFRRALADVDSDMQPFWRMRRQLQQAFADRFEAELPTRRDRTDRQELVARCPRCQRVISDEDAFEVALVERLRRDR